MSVLVGGTTCAAPAARADLVDATSKYANNAPDSAYSKLSFPELPTTTSDDRQALVAPTDEVTVTIPFAAFAGEEAFLGVELGEVEFRTNRRVFVRSVAPNSVAARYGAAFKVDSVVVSVNGVSAERTDLRGVRTVVRRALARGEDLVVVLRDPGSFQTQLRNLDDNAVATTQVAPGGDTTQYKQIGTVRYRPGGVTTEQTDQRLTVEQIRPAQLCRRPADVDDLLEISYTGRVAETGTIFDGSTVTVNNKGSVPGRGGDVTVYFVLGKQPFGQFPPGWDVGLQGMCVGEQRRLTVPPVLGYGSDGVPRRGIPPNATLVYDVTLLSLNGLATPQ